MTVFQRRDLGNGTRLLTAPMPQVESAACVVGLAAGTRYDTPETKGAAHFVEHVLFTGTERRPTMTLLAEEVESIGALINAGTGREHTYYWIRCMAGQVDQALDILADMLLNSRFDADEIEREKNVIVEEMRQTLQSPRDYVDEAFEHLLYGDQPLGWYLDGTEESVRATTRDTLLDFTGRWYTPARTVLGLGGRFDPQVFERVEELFGGRAAAEVAGPTPASLDGGDRRVSLEHRDVQQAELCLGLRAHPLDHPDRYVLEVIRTLLGGGLSSRLYRELVSEQGLAYSVAVSLQPYADTGSIFAQGGVNAERVDEAVTAIAEGFRRLAAEPVPEDELEKARNYTKGSFVFQVEAPIGLIRFGVRREAVEGRAAEPADVLAGLDAVTAGDIQRVMRELLEEGLYLAVIGPFDDAERFTRLIA